MSKNKSKRKLKPIEICPNGHYYNSSRTGEFCDVCGAHLDLPEDTPGDELLQLAHVEPRDRVCGWLVCIEGPHIGMDFKITDGKNYIGRSSLMPIHVFGDTKIEIKNHMVIAYDSNTKASTILPGESKGMIYWQGKAIFNPQKLSSGERIEIGESTFKFIPFCDDDFSWEMKSEGDDEEPGGV